MPRPVAMRPISSPRQAPLIISRKAVAGYPACLTDWLGFHKAPGSGHKGEYRGFPNAVHKQDGNYFHAMNAKTDKSTSTVEKVAPHHIRIGVTSDNGKWQGQYDFYADRLDFTMRAVSPGYKYWVQYEGVPGGTMDATDFWYSSADTAKHNINETSVRDLPAPE